VNNKTCQCSAYTRLQKKYKSLQKKKEHALVKLSRKIVSRTLGTNYVYAKRKANVSKRQQEKRKKALIEECRAAVSFLKPHKCVVEIKVKDIESQEVQTLTLSKNQPLHAEKTVVEESEINKWLYVKDKHCISNETFHELTQLDLNIPRSHQIKKAMKKMTEDIEIVPSPGNIAGAQLKVERRFREVLLLLMKKKYFSPAEPVNVKLSGDGTRLGIKFKIVDFGFTFLEEINMRTNFENEHVLTMFTCNENFGELKVALQDVLRDLERIQKDGLTIGRNLYHLNFFLCGDLKFLLIVLGLKDATSEYACPWCFVRKDERGNPNLKWSINDVQAGARALSSDGRLCCRGDSNRSKTVQSSVKHENLFHWIPLTQVVVDELHLFLRITDRLELLLIAEIELLDALSPKRKFQSNFDIEKFPCMNKYVKFIQSLGIPFSVVLDKTTQCYKFTHELRGGDKWKVINNINLPELLPSLPNVKSVQELWVQFREIMKSLTPKEKLCPADIENIGIKCTSWMNLFLSVYQSKNVTPYIHIFCYHVVEFLRLYGTLAPFSQQGQEKLNDQLSKIYFRSTSHKRHDAFIQMTKKRIRLERLAGAKRRKKNEEKENSI
jgi:hypothetical protein